MGTTSPPAKPKNASNGDANEYTQGQVQEINKKVDGKIQKVEENILQWIDEETKCLKDSLEKDITAIRSEVDEKNIELNSKVQATISNLKEEVNDKVAMMDTKLTDTMFNDNGNDLPLDDSEPSTGTNRQIMDLKNRLHSNCNTLRFLCSEPLSVQFSIFCFLNILRLSSRSHPTPSQSSALLGCHNCCNPPSPKRLGRRAWCQ